MNRLFFIVFGLLTLGNTQELDHLFEQFERGEIKDVKGKIPILLKKHPNDPGVKYLFGLTLMDGDSAIEVYEEIINKHSSSKYSEGASSKIGQYLYSRGLYTQASQHLRKFIFRYPKSKDLSRMMGMFLRSFDATGELDSAQYFVDKYLDSFHASINEYLDIDKEELHVDYSGIRPKPFGPKDKPKDFIIKNETNLGFHNFINLIGIESPGLTSSLAIAKYVKKTLN